jgi:hypothetical protein
LIRKAYLLAVQKEAGRVYRDHGSKGFYASQPRHSSASVLKGPVLEQAQQLLDGARSVPEVAAELNVPPNTWHKAIHAGRLRGPQKKSDRQTTEVTNKSERSQTDSQAPMTTLAVSLFARWSRENFFRYMREHFSLDRLIEYGTELIPDAISVVNPAWRTFDSQIRSKTGRRYRRAAQSSARDRCGKRFRLWIWRSTTSNNSARKPSITFR